ncbi:MAG: DegT/DnrJ/EryC1/StrS family aminotransferase [Saprospiraceae bacterium]|nr:DegT/DnrJ/EryC1/StrS family aminotransferase [Saprospiraceae bacterium]
MMDEILYVTRPDMPDLQEYVKYLERIWDSRWLTNNGPIHEAFESALCQYLGVKYLSLYSNATLALISAFKCLELSGEVITTPYSFVATSHALYWNGITPVFGDVDPIFGNLNPSYIERLITDRTSAILPVHVYGNPCPLAEIDSIARKYGLRVVYDAAHSFNVRIGGVPLVNFGDLSILSFHATKVFNTIEGGAIICKDEETKRKLDYFKNFGFENETSIVSPGINAKMNELQAAFGILQLDSIDLNIQKRSQIAQRYREQLKDIKGLRLIPELDHVQHNYSYFPIFVDASGINFNRDDLYEYLKINKVYSRRYFYPLISNIPTYKNLKSSEPQHLIVANSIAEQVLCLPIYSTLGLENVDRISKLIKDRFAGI